MDWSLQAGQEPPWILWVFLLAAVGLALFELVRSWRLQNGDVRARSRSLLLAATRVGALALVAGMLAEIGISELDELALRKRVAVLFDRSSSMATRGESETSPTRWTRAVTHWKAQSELLPHWREAGLAPDLYSFGATLDPVESGALEQLEPEAPASRLASALSRLSDLGRKRSTPLASLVVYSDGLVARDDAAREALVEDTLALEVPITAVHVAEPQLRDLAVGELSVGEFAFVENVTTLEVELRSIGVVGEAAEVELRREGELIASKAVRLDGPGEHRVSFDFAPEQTGQFAYQVLARPLNGEVNLRNNRRTFVLKVLRDKIRVLHVAGRPDWDVRSLRTLMRRDPNVELLSYYILRDEEDTLRDDADAPMSLIAFPTRELFHEQLGSFDLIILHNFDAMTHGDYLDNLARYAEDGGSLVIIGGDLGLATGDYATSALAPLLPVHTRGGLEREPFTPSLSEAGKRHPITSWLAGREERALIELDSFNPTRLRTRGDTPGQALLMGPDGAPLLTVAEPGRGRTLVLATGASWRLGFAPDLELIDGARPYDLLWLGIIRWALRDDAADRLSVQSDQAQYLPGQKVVISARSSSASYQPESGVELRWSVKRIDDRAAEPGGKDAKGDRGGRWTTDELGRARAELDGLPEGAYLVHVEREDSELHDKGARRVFVIAAGGSELAELDPSRGEALLRDLAERSGGEFIDVRDGSLPASLPQSESPRSAATRLRQTPLWSTWPFLTALLGLLGLEWYLRRRAGLR